MSTTLRATRDLARIAYAVSEYLTSEALRTLEPALTGPIALLLNMCAPNCDALFRLVAVLITPI
jgi:hypothetical protein